MTISGRVVFNIWGMIASYWIEKQYEHEEIASGTAYLNLHGITKYKYPVSTRYTSDNTGIVITSISTSLPVSMIRSEQICPTLSFTSQNTESVDVATGLHLALPDLALLYLSWLYLS